MKSSTFPYPCLSIAPMMDCTDRHYRYMMRLITQHTLLYTEMLHTNQLIYGDGQGFLDYHQTEHPLAIQLGGSEPEKLAQCARMAEDHGYDEVNLNVGCPSERVQKGSFGACLMNQPNLVAECVAAMMQAVSIPVTVKTRLGVDHQDDFAFIEAFIRTVAETGCDTFILHARKAWLKGLSPKQNRTVPPLNYERVYQLKASFPQLTLAINGGIKTLQDVKQHLCHVDSVMIGREAFNRPWLFAHADRQLFHTSTALPKLSEVLQNYQVYMEQELTKGVRFNLLIRPVLGLFHGLPGGKALKNALTSAKPMAMQTFSRVIDEISNMPLPS